MLPAPRIALLAVACLAVAPAAPARAQFGSLRRAEAVVIDPFLLAPTSFVAPTTYYATSYGLAPTAYYDAVPASYAETRYVYPRRYRYRAGLVATRYYEDSYSPAAYYVPTSSAVVYPTTTTSYGSICDEPARVTTGRTVTEPAPTTTLRSEPPTTSTPEPRFAPRKLSVPRDADPAVQDRAADRGAAPEPTSPPAGDPVIPPVRPVEEPLPANIDPEVPPVQGGKGPRTVQRFVFPDGAVLRGDVLKAGEPQQGLKVQLVSRTDPAKYQDLEAVTDADGHFAIRVPSSGDWTVKVARPGGRQILQDFRLASGRFRDGKGEFPSLIIEQ